MSLKTFVVKEICKRQWAVGRWPESHVSRRQRSGEKGSPVSITGAQWSMFGITENEKKKKKKKKTKEIGKL